MAERAPIETVIQQVFKVRATAPRWLRPGETVSIEIEGLVVLSNPVAAE
ncbi:MAG: hypothetical protein OXG68_06490 [Chloroflexi bacterium]|nr:hypothetical protein [Chloroflexota bacterium]